LYIQPIPKQILIIIPYAKDAFIGAICQILSDRDTYHPMAENARHGSREFVWGVLLDKEVDLIRQAYAQTTGAGLAR
jgi:glycosyltransferase involved in cell wall biosynthesis